MSVQATSWFLTLRVEHFAGIQNQIGIPGFFDGLHQVQLDRVGVFK